METASQFVPDGDRAWFKWNEPPEFGRGARLVLEVVIPSDELTTPATEPSAADKARIILIAPVGQFAVMRSASICEAGTPPATSASSAASMSAGGPHT
jgi:hypothetical protein